MKKSIMILMLMISSFTILAEDNYKNDAVKTKEKLEKGEEINNTIKYTVKEELDKIKKDIKANGDGVSDYKNTKTIAFIVLVFLGIGGFGSCKAIIGKSESFMLEKVSNEAEKINDRILSEYREKLKTECILRETKKILVIFEEEFRDLDDKLGNINLRKYLSYFKLNTTFKNINEVINEEVKEYELIIFANGEDSKGNRGNYNIPKAQEIIDNVNRKKTVFFYHNEYRRNQDLKNCYINNSNSFVTLYRNIMDTLEFQNYLFTSENTEQN